MGNQTSLNKSKLILKYYCFQRKINKYLNNLTNNRPDKTSTKEGYIINPIFIKQWKAIIKYNKLSDLLLQFKIKSYKSITNDQRLLINDYIENDYNINQYDIYKYYNNNYLPNSFNSRNINLIYMYIKNKKVFWESFINEKTLQEMNLYNNYIKIKYIFKSKILILFFKEYFLFKMFLHKKQLIELTFQFSNEDRYEDLKEMFKKWPSDKIILFLKERNIFYQKYYTQVSRIETIEYTIKNESFGKNNYYFEKNIIKRPENINYNYINRISYRGLDNVGATCYMNATLQCLANIKPVTDYLLNANNYSDLFFNEKLCPLTLGYTQVLIGLFLNSSQYGSYRPENFKNIISEMNPLFQGIQANDSKDLIIFLLEEINNELVLLNNKKNNINQNANEILKITNIYDENEIHKIFLLNFEKSHSSIIGRNLCGYTKNRFICQNCGKVAVNFNIYNFLIFGLEAISKYFNLSNYNTMIPTINFDQCFQYLTKEEIFHDTYCQNCKLNFTSKYNEIIYNFPNYLIIILNRGKGNIFNCNVIIPENFDASNYMENKTNSKEIYKLVGVVSHLGESGMGGHFIAFCKHNIDNIWRCYNDSIVTECQGDYLTKGIPYILFYKKKISDTNKKNYNNKNNNFQNILNINSFNSQNNMMNNFNNINMKNNGMNNINMKNNMMNSMNNINMMNNNIMMNNNMINNNMMSGNNMMNYNNMNYNNMMNNNMMNGNNMMNYNNMMNNNMMNYNNMINNNMINNNMNYYNKKIDINNNNFQNMNIFMNNNNFNQNMNINLAMNSC